MVYIRGYGHETIAPRWITIEGYPQAKVLHKKSKWCIIPIRWDKVVQEK